MNRKSFLQKLSLTTSGLMLGGTAFLEKYRSGKEITVLHTNDTLAHVDPLPESEDRYSGMGGMARRDAFVKQVRKRESPTLLLDAGNVFGDTEYADLFGMALIYQMMTDMGYDAATVGFRDFDRGIRGFLKAAGEADFPFIVSNYDIRHGDLARFMNKYKIFNKGSIRIGVFGLGENLEKYAQPEISRLIEYRDPLLMSEAMVRKLRHQLDCDLVICLSQLGYHSGGEAHTIDDVKLARQVTGIDMIAGGKTRCFMKRGEKIQGADGMTTIVSQAGYGGAMVGKTSFEFSSQNWLRKIFSSNQLLRSET